MRNVFIAIIFLQSCSQLPSRPLHQKVEVTQSRGGEFQFCKLNCPIVSKKTVKQKKYSLVVHFDSGKKRLKPSLQQKIRQMVHLLFGQEIIVKGFTDNTGTMAVNQKVAQLRALEVTNFLVGLGIKRSMIKVSSHPLCCYLNQNRNRQEQAINRRVEIKTTSLKPRRNYAFRQKTDY